MIAEQAPDLHQVLDQAKREGRSHLMLDGTLIRIDRVNERNDDGHHRWRGVRGDAARSDNGGRSSLA